jgi:hypothetical protein
LTAGLVIEIVMTFMFLIVILGATHKRAPSGFAGLAIGLAQHLREPRAQHSAGASPVIGGPVRP